MVETAVSFLCLLLHTALPPDTMLGRHFFWLPHEQPSAASLDLTMVLGPSCPRPKAPRACPKLEASTTPVPLPRSWSLRGRTAAVSRDCFHSWHPGELQAEGLQRTSLSLHMGCLMAFLNSTPPVSGNPKLSHSVSPESHIPGRSLSSP